jgi:tetratricopeptide (TPR) repeat protein
VVASWNFAGTYKDGGTLEARANADIARLKGLMGSPDFTKYELYVSIANQYELLGDGKQEFTYLNYALAIDSTKTGLAWHNMGKLLERLGAYKSARVAYDRAVQAQSTSQYIRARLEFLQAHMPEDTDAIAQAQADLAASSW